MADSTSNSLDGSRDSEEKMISFTVTAVTALCCSLKGTTKDAANFNCVMPLLIATLSQCPSNAENFLVDLLNGIYDFARAVQSEEFVHSQSLISKVMDPVMETLPVHHPLFCSFLSSFDRLCDILTDNAMSLKRSLIKMCIRALRFPLNDYGTDESSRVKKAKSSAWDLISKWTLFPSYFEPITLELSDTVLEQIDGENNIENLKKYVGELHVLINVVKCGLTITKPRRMWIRLWRTLNQLIEEDRERQLTNSCIKEVGYCILVMETDILAETHLNEIGLMMKDVLEKETTRRDYEPQIEHNNRTEESGGLLNNIVSIILCLFKKKVPICNILYPMMPIAFSLIEKCSNKHWGLRFVNILIEYADEFALEYRDQIVPLLFHSLNDSLYPIRRIAANSFGFMAESNLDQWKKIAVSSLDFVCQLMYREDARQEDSIIVTEDAVSTVIKIIGNCNEKDIGIGRMNEIMLRFLSWFPLTGASKECDIAYCFLLDLIDCMNPFIMGEANTNSPRVLFILTKAIHDEVLEDYDAEDLKKRTKNKINQMVRSSDSLNEWIRRSGLNEEELKTLSDILSLPDGI